VEVGVVGWRGWRRRRYDARICVSGRRFERSEHDTWLAVCGLSPILGYVNIEVLARNGRKQWVSYTTNTIPTRLLMQFTRFLHRPPQGSIAPLYQIPASRVTLSSRTLSILRA